MNTYAWEAFKKDLRLPVLVATAFSLLACIGLGIAGAASMADKRVTGSALITTIGLFVLAYFLGALGSAVAVFIFRPLRRSWVGWAVTGGLVSFSFYGALSSLITLGGPRTAWLGTLRGGPPLEPGSLVPFLIIVGLVLVPIGAAFGVYWRDNPP